MINSEHQVQYTPSIAYTEYSIHCVLQHPNINCLPLLASLSSFGRPCCTQFSTFPQLCVNQWIQSQLLSRFLPDLPPPDCPPPSPPPFSLDHGLQVHLQTCSITGSKCVSKLTRFRPPSLHDHGLPVPLQTGLIMASKFVQSQPPSAYLQTRMITASKCISKPTRSWPPSVSANSLDWGLHGGTIKTSKCISILAGLRPHSFHYHGLPTCNIPASECITKFTWSWCGEWLELEGRQPIINTPLHLAWHRKEILEAERFQVEKRRKKVWG